MEDKRELTFGEKAVGLSFNPSNNPSVDECKRQFAKAIDFLHEFRSDAKVSDGAKRHASIAITELESAQMRAVKALTWTE
jgi:hypothetical protein